MRPLTWRLTGARGRRAFARPLAPITIGRYKGGFTLHIDQAVNRELLARALSIEGVEDIESGSLELTVRSAAGKVLTTIRSNAAGLTVAEAAEMRPA